MPIDHVVQQGEFMSQIARRYGFRDFETIWDHPSNAELKQLRGSPNVLLAGDIVHVPDKQSQTVGVATDAIYRFRVDGQALKLRLVIRDFGGEPLANAACKLAVDGRTLQLVTDGDGMIEVDVSPAAQDGTLVFTDPDMPFDLSTPLRIGFLDPVDQASGQWARLGNLGYITRPPDALDETFLSLVVQEFQCDTGLEVSGVCDATTQAKLLAMHGS